MKYFITCNSVVELQSGKIEIDGKNIRDMGLDFLRHRLALVPQDSTMFSGTLRDNMSVLRYVISYPILIL